MVATGSISFLVPVSEGIQMMYQHGISIVHIMDSFCYHLSISYMKLCSKWMQNWPIQMILDKRYYEYCEIANCNITKSHRAIWCYPFYLTVTSISFGVVDRSTIQSLFVLTQYAGIMSNHYDIPTCVIYIMRMVCICIY